MDAYEKNEGWTSNRFGDRFFGTDEKCVLAFVEEDQNHAAAFGDRMLAASHQALHRVQHTGIIVHNGLAASPHLPISCSRDTA